MAGQFLINISTLDLSGVAVTSDEVGRLNPQTGDMRQLDYVAWMNDDASEGVGVKNVRKDEFWVAGHVPGRPIFPGVLMIEAGAQLCSVLFKKKTGNLQFLGFIRCDDIVFRGQVVPGDTLYLLGKEVIFGARRFSADVQGVVKKKLVFEGRIMGMAL